MRARFRWASAGLISPLVESCHGPFDDVVQRRGFCRLVSGRKLPWPFRRRRQGMAFDGYSFGGTIGCELDKPPSTGKAWPLTYEASSDARNKAICAISTGAPARRSGLS